MSTRTIPVTAVVALLSLSLCAPAGAQRVSLGALAADHAEILDALTTPPDAFQEQRLLVIDPDVANNIADCRQVPADKLLLIRYVTASINSQTRSDFVSLQISTNAASQGGGLNHRFSLLASGELPNFPGTRVYEGQFPTYMFSQPGTHVCVVFNRLDGVPVAEFGRITIDGVLLPAAP